MPTTAEVLAKLGIGLVAPTHAGLRSFVTHMEIPLGELADRIQTELTRGIEELHARYKITGICAERTAMEVHGMKDGVVSLSFRFSTFLEEEN